MIKKIFFSFVFCCLAAGLYQVLPVQAAGSSLYFSPSASTQSVGAKFTVAVKINTNSQAINASDGSISFNKNLLKVVSVSKNASLLDFWIEEPAFSNNAGSINFAGGVPRPGYEGNGGTIFSIVFQPIAAGEAEVTFVSGSVLAGVNGTNVLTAMGGANFSISPAIVTPEAVKKEAEVAAAVKDGSSLLMPAVSSETNPDQDIWYRDRKVKFSWVLNPGIEGVSVAFDKNPNSDPGNESDGLFDSKEYVADSDGVWYFHIKFKDSKNWGTTANYQVKIDMTPPEPFEAWSKQEDPNDWPTIFFKTMDKLSGLVRYFVVVNSLKSEPYIISADKDSLKLSDLEAGMHKIMVRAVDEAGNETYTTSEVEIRPILEPKVENYSQELSAEDKFFVSGTSLPEATVKIFIKKDGEEKVANYSVNSDKGGTWSFVSGNNFSFGRYIFWTEAVNFNGLVSRPSTALSFLVTPPIFARIGSLVINYFTVVASLLFVIVLIIFLAVLTAKILRKRLKKETYEIEEVLEKHLEILKSALANEAATLLRISKDKAPLAGRQAVSLKTATKGDLSKEIISFKDRLDEKIDETGRKIMKEIKDVEKILK